MKAIKKEGGASMSTETARSGIFSNNALKIIAAALMVCDHVGMLLFPGVSVFRNIGRLAFPIFAYLIAEGAKYTRNYLRYFLTMASFATVIQIGYYCFRQSLEMSVMVTFTLSLMIIFSLDCFKAAIFTKNPSKLMIAATAALLFGTVCCVAILDRILDLDYRFWGCMLPVFPSLLTTPKVKEPPAIFQTLDKKLPRILAAAIGTLILALHSSRSQFYGLLAIPLLLLYSEQRGKWNIKYFFYVFYPLHLVILYGISMLVK